MQNKSHIRRTRAIKLLPLLCANRTLDGNYLLHFVIEMLLNGLCRLFKITWEHVTHFRIRCMNPSISLLNDALKHVCAFKSRSRFTCSSNPCALSFF